MTTFFTSDSHFGHRGIIRYCDRPFGDTDAMDAHLVARWNSVVGDDDEVYHLGDFTLKSRGFARRIFSQLRGRIRVLGLPWHHDRGWVPKRTGPCDLVSASDHPVEILPPMLAQRFVLDDVKITLTLSHYPLAEWEGSHRGGWHLHGHSHGGHSGPGPKLDVGVDCTDDYAPISLAAVAARLRDCAPLPVSD